MGTVAHYESNRTLNFVFPRELADCLPDGKFGITRNGDDWEIAPGGNSRLRRANSKNDFTIVVGSIAIARDLPYFGKRQATYIASGGHVLVSLLEPVMPQFADADAAGIDLVGPTAELKQPLAAQFVDRLGTRPDETDLRALLAALRHVEANTEWRIDREEGRIKWSRPGSIE